MNADRWDSLTQRVLGANECEPSDCGSFFSPGPPRGTLPLPPCQDLVNWLVVREHPPFHNLAVANYRLDRKSTRLNSSHLGISYAVFCLKTKKYTVRLASPVPPPNRRTGTREPLRTR